MKKKIETLLLNALPAAIVIVGLCSIGQTSAAQNPARYDVVSSQEQPTQHSEEQKAAPEAKAFTGRIVKTGDLFVLVAAEGKTSYKLDDQQTAKEFVNQDVKVTGVLDDSTGMIRVNSIVPA